MTLPTDTNLLQQRLATIEARVEELLASRDAHDRRIRAVAQRGLDNLLLSDRGSYYTIMSRAEAERLRTRADPETYEDRPDLPPPPPGQSGALAIVVVVCSALVTVAVMWAIGVIH